MSAVQLATSLEGRKKIERFFAGCWQARFIEPDDQLPMLKLVEAGILTSRRLFQMMQAVRERMMTPTEAVEEALEYALLHKN